MDFRPERGDALLRAYREDRLQIDGLVSCASQMGTTGCFARATAPARWTHATPLRRSRVDRRLDRRPVQQYERRKPSRSHRRSIARGRDALRISPISALVRCRSSNPPFAVALRPVAASASRLAVRATNLHAPVRREGDPAVLALLRERACAAIVVLVSHDLRVRRWLDRRRSRNHRVQCRITIWHCRLDAARITPTPPTLFLAKRGGVRRRRTSAHSDPPFFCVWFRGGSEPDRGGVGSKPPRRRHAEDGVGGCDRGAAAVVRG